LGLHLNMIIKFSKAGSLFIINTTANIVENSLLRYLAVVFMIKMFISSQVYRLPKFIGSLLFDEYLSVGFLYYFFQKICIF